MTVIAMTREIGSLGTEVAAGVAKRLGLEIVRSEVAANNVARRLGVAEGAVTRYLEGSASLLERWQIDRRKLFQLRHRGNPQPRPARQRPDQGLGRRHPAPRCAARDQRARVRAHGLPRPRHDGAARAARTPRRCATRSSASMPPAPARCAPISTSSRRTRGLYHIVLNTERLSVDACVDAICKLAEGSRFRDTFKSRSALANKLLEAKISSALVEHISVAMAPLGMSVSVANGKVTLAGTTCSGSLRKRAEKIAHASRRHVPDRQPHHQRADPRQRVLSLRARFSRGRSSRARSQTPGRGSASSGRGQFL